MIDYVNQLYSNTSILDNDLEEAIVNDDRICFFIKYCEKIYLITASHNISENSELHLSDNTCVLKDNKIFVPELDLLIIELSSTERPFFNLDEEDYFNNYYNMDSKSITFLNAKKKICELESIRYEISNYNSICLPEMMKFLGRYNGEELEGCSGSPVLMNDKICGIISGYNEKVIIITPFIFVKRILDEYIKYNKFSGLCGFYYKTKYLNRNLFAGNLLANHNYYQKNLDVLKQNDLIIEIDGYYVNNSQIELTSYDLIVNIETYVNLTKTIHDVINLKVLRNNKLLELAIGCRDLNSSYSIDFKSKDYCFKVTDDGKYFMPLNFKTFEFLSKFRDLCDDKKLISNFKSKISNSINEKDILVFDPKNNYNILISKFDDYLVLDL